MIATAVAEQPKPMRRTAQHWVAEPKLTGTHAHEVLQTDRVSEMNWDSIQGSLKRT